MRGQFHPHASRNLRRVRPAPVLCIALIGIALLNPARAEWPRVEDPASAGWDSEQLESFRRFLIEDTVITGLVIAHRGAIVFDYGDIEENSYIASVRKSVLAMLYGRYVEAGVIDLSDTVGELGIDDVQGLLPVEKTATVKDLIEARSGVYHPEGYPGGWQEYAPARGSVRPGEYWLYNNWDFNVAGYVFEQQTGRNIYDEVEAQLATPLAMEDWDRGLQEKSGDTSISRYLAYPMWFSTRDMARIGQLMLQRGNWEGRQLISEAWVDEMLAQRTSAEEINRNAPVLRDAGVKLGYGYMWWLFEDVADPRLAGAYAGLGAMGQAIAIYPAIDTVVAYKTRAAYRRVNSFPTRMDTLRRAVAAFSGVPGAD